MRPLVTAVAGVLAVLCVAAPAAADQDDLLGRPIVDVVVMAGGERVVDPSVLALVETRIGERLAMEQVRSTIDHFVGLGRFDDVRVSASPSADGTGVVLRWDARPIQRIGEVRLEGGSVVSEAAVRTFVSERFGAAPPASRAQEIAAAAAALYVERGFASSRLTPRLEEGRIPGVVSLVLDVASGPRTTISAATVTGQPTEPAARIIDRLEVGAGRPYDRVGIQERLARYETSLRDQGYYEATVRETARLSDNQATAAVTIDVEPGPRVRVVFAGDPMPEARLDTLVPVREERSVDQDLLEDGSRNIETYLRERGYRAAEAPYQQSESNGELVLTYTVSRGPLHRLGRQSVRGNQAIPEADLQPLLKLTAGEPFVDARMAAVGAAITELYRVRGFISAAVKPAVEVLPEETDGNVRFRPVDVRFDVVEGQQTLVTDVRFDGPRAVASEKLSGLLGLTAGRPFYRPQLDADRDAIATAYHNDGYLSMSVAPAVEVTDGGTRAQLTWRIAEGEQTLVDHVLITGQVRTNPSVIRRELTLEPGKPLGEAQLIESQRRVSALGLFRRVRITPLARTGTASRDVLVEVEESPATTITYGGGLEAGRRTRQSETGGAAVERVEVAPRAFFQISRRNFWGKNRELSFFSRVVLRPRDPPVDSTDPTDTGGYGLNEYRFSGTFREPRPLGLTGDAQLTGFLERGIRASFSFDRSGVRADYARRIGSSVSVTGRYTYDYTELFDEQIAPEDQLLIDRLFPQVLLSTFFGAVLRDSRDDVLDPQRGAVLGLDGSVAARAYGSEVGFAKTFLQGFLYRRLPGRGFVLATGARLGLARGFPREVPRVDEDGQPVLGPDGGQIVDVVKDLPASERFYAGGDTTVRGFALDRLGVDETLDEQGFPQGGNGLILLNAELRAPYWKGLGVVGFVDSGNVFKNASDIDLSRIRFGVGFGVRYRSPIGPVRADLGFKTDPQVLAGGSRERGYVLHISLGQAF